jgi:hypothetical protein
LQILKTLRAAARVGCLCQDAAQEERNPVRPSAPLADREQEVIVLRAIPLEEGAEVEERSRKQVPVSQQERDQQPPMRPFPSRKGWIASN